MLSCTKQNSMKKYWLTELKLVVFAWPGRIYHAQKVMHCKNQCNDCKEKGNGKSIQHNRSAQALG